jgi:hypothetical protein
VRGRDAPASESPVRAARTASPRRRRLATADDRGSAARPWCGHSQSRATSFRGKSSWRAGSDARAAAGS